MNNYVLQIQTLLETLQAEEGVCIKNIEIAWHDVSSVNNSQKLVDHISLNCEWQKRYR